MSPSPPDLARSRKRFTPISPRGPEKKRAAATKKPLPRQGRKGYLAFGPLRRNWPPLRCNQTNLGPKLFRAQQALTHLSSPKTHGTPSSLIARPFPLLKNSARPIYCRDASRNAEHAKKHYPARWAPYIQHAAPHRGRRTHLFSAHPMPFHFTSLRFHSRATAGSPISFQFTSGQPPAPRLLEPPAPPLRNRRSAPCGAAISFHFNPRQPPAPSQVPRPPLFFSRQSNGGRL